VQMISELEFFTPDVKGLVAFLEKGFGATSSFWEDVGFMKFSSKLTAMVHTPRKPTLKQRTAAYFTVKNVKAEIDRLVALGAKLYLDPVEIKGMGSYAYVEVPGDLIFGLWEYAGAEPAATEPAKKPTDEGTLTYVQINTPQAKAAADFFEKAWGWKFSGNLEKEMGFCKLSEWISLGIMGVPAGQQANLIPTINTANMEAKMKELTALGATAGHKGDTPEGTYQIIHGVTDFPMCIWQQKEKGKDVPDPTATTASSQEVTQGIKRAPADEKLTDQPPEKKLKM